MGSSPPSAAPSTDSFADVLTYDEARCRLASGLVASGRGQESPAKLPCRPAPAANRAAPSSASPVTAARPWWYSASRAAGSSRPHAPSALARSLLAADLVDRLNLYLYPIAFGTGKRLFDTGTVPAAFSLAQQPIAFPKGAVSLVYERAGVPVTGIQMEE